MECGDGAGGHEQATSVVTAALLLLFELELFVSAVLSVSLLVVSAAATADKLSAAFSPFLGGVDVVVGKFGAFC